MRILLAVVLLASPAVAQLPVRSSPLTETERAIHLLSRATYGVRPSDVSELVSMGRDAWLEQQLHPETIADEEFSAPIRSPTPPRGVLVAPPAMPILMAPPVVRAPGVSIPENMVIDKLRRAAYSRRQLEEVMTDFWFNHFNVSYQKREVRGLGTFSHYERTAIRERVFGRFEDMLLAVARHPAMLMYLDNHFNTTPGPQSPGGGGINENYARELLELHTLGVDGGYTQQDVIEVARAFTGWSVLMARNSTTGAVTPILGVILLEFRPEWHDTDAKIVLGRALAPGRGLEDGEEVITLLARHPSTAHHIATKLVRHLVSDQPPADLVAEIAEVFTATNGDLREVTRALFTSEAFYRPEHYRAKVKRPFELVASTLRFTGAQPLGGRVTLELLNNFSHIPYNEPAPTGYPATADEWMGAGAILSRANFGLDVAAGRYFVSPIDPWLS